MFGSRGVIYGSMLERVGLLYQAISSIRRDNSKEKFWQDLCCGENPFAMCFLELFKICCDKWASVVDLMKLTNGVLH